MIFTQAGLIFVEDAIEQPVQLIFDSPMVAYCLCCGLRVKLGRCDAIARLDAAGTLVDLRFRSLEAGLGRVSKDALDLLVQGRLIGFATKRIISPCLACSPGNGGLAGGRIDGNDSARQGGVLRQSLQQQHKGGNLLSLVGNRLLPQRRPSCLVSALIALSACGSKNDSNATILDRCTINPEPTFPAMTKAPHNL